jgi:hypothetical protein
VLDVLLDGCAIRLTFWPWDRYRGKRVDSYEIRERRTERNRGKPQVERVADVFDRDDHR